MEHKQDQKEILEEILTLGLGETISKKEFDAVDNPLDADDEESDDEIAVRFEGEVAIDPTNNSTPTLPQAEGDRQSYDCSSIGKFDAESERRLQLISFQTKDKRSKEKKEKSNIGIIDFAGQWVYQTIHHVFIRTQCVFILVLNLCIKLDQVVTAEMFRKPEQANPTFFAKLFGFGRPKDLKSVKYVDQIILWLNTILSHLRGNHHGKVIVVGTHKDRLARSISKQEELAGLYFTKVKERLVNKAHKQMIKDTFAVDNKGGDEETFRKLRPAILKLVQQHCGWDEERPIRWLQMEKHLHILSEEETSVNQSSLPLKEMPGNHLLKFEEVCKLGRKYNITPEDMIQFCKFHHATGDITYLHTEELQHYIVADPQWLVDVL